MLKTRNLRSKIISSCIKNIRKICSKSDKKLPKINSINDNHEDTETIEVSRALT